MRSLALAALATSVASCVCLASPAGAASKGRVLWRGDFQTGSTNQWDYVQEARKNSITVTKKVHAPGYQYSAEFTAHIGDDPITTPDRIRAEVAENVQHTGAVAGHTRWYGWQTMFPVGFDTALAPSWLAFTQWHQAGADGTANVALFYERIPGEPDVLTFQVHGGQRPSEYESSSMRDFTLGSVRFRHWYTFELGVHWSASSKRGRVQLWMDGKKVASARLATLYTHDQAYLKQGIYGKAAPKPITVYESGMRIGTSRSAVTPRS